MKYIGKKTLEKPPKTDDNLISKNSTRTRMGKNLRRRKNDEGKCKKEENIGEFFEVLLKIKTQKVYVRRRKLFWRKRCDLYTLVSSNFLSWILNFDKYRNCVGFFELTNLKRLFAFQERPEWGGAQVSSFEFFALVG